MDITLLPCFLGDADPVLARVPRRPVARIGDVWQLTHNETRQTKRARLLCEHIRTAMQDYSIAKPTNITTRTEPYRSWHLFLMKNATWLHKTVTCNYRCRYLWQPLDHVA